MDIQLQERNTYVCKRAYYANVNEMMDCVCNGKNTIAIRNALEIQNSISQLRLDCSEMNVNEIVSINPYIDKIEVSFFEIIKNLIDDEIGIDIMEKLVYLCLENDKLLEMKSHSKKRSFLGKCMNTKDGRWFIIKKYKSRKIDGVLLEGYDQVIDRIFVRPDKRRRGIGTLMIRDYEQRYKKPVQVRNIAETYEAVRFWESMNKNN